MPVSMSWCGWWLQRMETPLAGEGRESGSDGGPAWLDAFLAPEKAAPGR